jgi:O-antigen/teichoic acid export membrane protein
VAAHLLGPGRYGDLAALTGLTYLAGPVFISIQTVTSRMSTTLAMRGEYPRIRGLLRYYSIRLVLFGFIAGGLVAALSGAVARIIHLPSSVPVAIVGSVFVLFSLTHIQRGALQGMQAFGRYGLSAAFEGIAKIVAAVLIITMISRTETGAIAAIPVAAGCGIGVNWALLRFLPRPEERVRPVTHPYRYSLVTLATLLLLAVLLSADVIAGRHYLASHTAGLYAAVSLSGRVVFFATTSLTYFMFPIFSERQDRGSDGRRSLAAGLAILVAVALVIVTAYFVSPNLLVQSLFGDRFTAAEGYIGWMGIAFGLYGAAYLTAMFLLSQKRHVGIVVLGCAVLLQMAGFYRFHGSIRELIGVQLVAFGGAAATLICLAFVARRHRKPSESVL